MQNQANEQWNSGDVTTKLRNLMHAAVDSAFNRCQAFVVGEEKPAGTVLSEEPAEVPDFRTVALLIALERVTRATLMRGIWP